MEEVQVAPPNIWTFEECAAVNTDGVNMKEYKPTGQFYADASMLCTIFGVKPHPLFREPTAPSAGDAGDGETAGGLEEPKRAKEPTTITVCRYRLDPNSMKVLFKVLEGCTHIQTLK